MDAKNAINIEEIVEIVTTLVEQQRIYEAVKVMLSIEPHDLIDVLDRLENSVRRKIISAVPLSHIASILARLPDELLYEIVISRGLSEFTRILIDVPPDDAADVLQKLPSRIRNQILNLLPPWKVEEVTKLLRYPPESAGGVMTTRVPVFSYRERIGKVIEKYVTKYQLGLYDKHSYVYGVDDEQRLVGWIDVKSLLTAPRDKLLGDVLTKPPAVVRAEADREEAARLVLKYDLLEIPVIDSEGRFLGAITIDDLLDVMVAELTEDLLKFGGYLNVIRGRYLGAKTIELVRKRIPWLLILYVLESITASIINAFSSIIASVAVLAAFIPLLTDTGGNVGSQTATLVIRSLAIGEARSRDIVRILSKELQTACILALLLAPVGFLVAMLVSRELLIALTVMFALMSIIIASSAIGSLLPFVALLLKSDPAVVSSPFLTTLADVVGLMMYFIIARSIMGVG